jgi:class 3 adenylate cyclase
MEPRIQYAKTKDGVSIALWTLGEGVPLVCTIQGQFAHIQLEWEHPEFRRYYERLAEKRMVVRYDGRGCGLSDRDVMDYSLEAHLLDLEAVVDRLGLGRFALFTLGGIGPAAIAYAARYPERVSHLILFATWARGSDYMNLQQVQGILGLLDKDWQMFTENLSHSVLGWSEGEQAHWFAALLRETTTPEAMRAALAATTEYDVTSLLPEVRSPTLVIHRREVVALDTAIAKGLASRIPDAQLVVVKGTSMAPYVGDIEPMLRAIDDFLGEGEEAAAKTERLAPDDIHTILFTDIEGSTALTQRLGDAKARDLLREHERLVREALKTHGGSEVKTMGDGFMTSFASATKALDCAIAMQRAFAAQNESAEEPIMVRIGLNAGEPIAEDEDLFGTAVNLAARIAAEAEAGTILASDVVRQLVAGKDFLFADRGEASLKGFDEPVRLYEVRWQD